MANGLAALHACYAFTPEGWQREKAELGERKGTSILYRTKFKSESDNRASSELVVLFRSTNQGIKLGLTRGQVSARRPQTCVQNNALVSSTID